MFVLSISCGWTAPDFTDCLHLAYTGAYCR